MARACLSSKVALVEIRKVIYVEDEPDIRTVVALILSTYDIEVTQFGSGAEAIAKAGDLQPDLILMDLTMAEMDGIESLKRLREISGYEKIPCVFVTARIDDQATEDLNGIENASVIRKPFDPGTLVDELKTIVKEMGY